MVDVGVNRGFHRHVNRCADCSRIASGTRACPEGYRMSGRFIEGQADYLLFVYGLALVLLAGACAWLKDSEDRRLPWAWLAWFAVFAATDAWLDLLSLSFGTALLSAVHPFITGTALACLLRFAWLTTLPARSAPQSSRAGRLVGPLVLVCMLGALGQLQAAWPWVQAGLGMAGGLWAARAIWRCRVHAPSLSAAAACMTAHAAIWTLEPTDLPVWHLMFSATDEATAAADALLLLLRVLLATGMAFSIWRYAEETASPSSAVQGEGGRKRSSPALVLVLIGVAAGGWGMALVVGNEAKHNMVTSLFSQTRLVAAGLDVTHVEQLKGTADDLPQKAYSAVKLQLAELRHANEDCRFIYLLARPGREVIFLADSEPADSPDCSPAGQVYSEASPEVIGIFDAPCVFMEGPIADRWGQWVSGFAPVRSPSTGRLVAMLGMDLSAQRWNRQICAWRLPVICVTLLLCLMIVGFASSQQRARVAAERIAASESSYRGLVEGLPNSVALLDRDGRCLTINRQGLRKLGMSEADVLGNAYASVFFPSATASVEAAIDKAVQGWQHTLTVHLQAPDGTRTSCELMLNPVRAAGSQVSRIVAIGTDVTDRVRAQEAQLHRLVRLQRQHAATVRLAADRSLGAGSFSQATHLITEVAADALQLERVGVWVLDDDRRTMHCIDVYSAQHRTHSQGMVLDVSENPRSFAALEAERVVEISDVAQDPRAAELLIANVIPAGIASLLGAAIRVGGEVVGVLSCGHAGIPRAWHDDEVVLAGVIADKTAQLIVRTKREQVEEALRESEARLKTIVESIQAGLVVIDAQTHTVVDVNPAALSIIGSSREMVLGKECHELFHSAGPCNCPDTPGKQSVHNCDCSLVRATGETVSILKTVVPVVLHGRQHLLESFIDITQRKQAEAELAAHREQLEQLVHDRTDQLMEAERQVLQTEKLASVGRLAAGVAHEINTPIQYVGDNLHALADVFQDLRGLLENYQQLAGLVAGCPSGPEAMASIRSLEERIDLPFILEDAPKAIAQGLEGVQRVASIVRAMKDFSHVKGGVSAVADINQCLASTLTVARNEYKYSADIETHFGELPSVECYPSELNQVFLNLLVNAVHAIQDTQRRGRIVLTTRVVDDCVEIAIADNGAGIPQEIRDKVYDLFFTTKGIGKGTGQGLYIAHQIVVKKHGGTLTCESTVGEGTTFRICIPVHLTEACVEKSSDKA